MENLLLQYGIWGIFILAVLDHSGLPSGLLVGLSLVGAGLYDLSLVLILVWLAGMVGDLLFYGLALFLAKPARQFLEKYFHAHEALVKTEKAFEKYDSLFLIWARFVPFAGRYAPFVYASFQPKFFRFLTFIALGNAMMLMIFALPIVLLGEKAQAWFKDPLSIFYITIAVLFVQAVVVTLWSLFKKWRA